MRGKGLPFSKGSNCLAVHTGQSLQQSQKNNAATCRKCWRPSKQQDCVLYPPNSSYWATCGGCNIKAARKKNSADLCQALHHGMIKQDSGATGVLVCHGQTVALPSFNLHWLLWEYEYLPVCRVVDHADSKDTELLFQFHVRQNFTHGIL